MSQCSFLFEDPKPSTSGQASDKDKMNSIEEIAVSVIKALSQMREDQSHVNKPQQEFTIQQNKHKFQASIDVQHFRPKEISVLLTEYNTVIVEAKHEEKKDEHGYISRHFVRRFVLPDDCVQGLNSKLSPDGVLTVTASKKTEAQEQKSRDIPIIRADTVNGKNGKTEQKE